MLNISLYKDDRLFRNALIASVVFHLVLWGGFSLKHFLDERSTVPTIEIDLTKPFRIGGNPLLKPGGGTTSKSVKKPGPPGLLEKPEEQKKPEPPKDWVLPSPNTKVLEKPVLETPQATTKIPGGDADGTGDGWQGTGGGWGGGEGQGGGIPLTRFPQLLNKKEVLKLLRRNYPEAERQAGVEGVVVVDLHLDADGKVTAVDIVDSAGVSFDKVADKVAQKMRFTPALLKTKPVAVKIRQSIAFQLEGE